MAHQFPLIGHKVMILNARQIHFKDDLAGAKFPPIILLAMEDITEMMSIADTLVSHTNQFEIKMTSKTDKLDLKIRELNREIKELKKKTIK